MATSVVFDLTDTLVTTLRAAITTASVYDGYGITDDPGDFVMVGIDDPDGNRGQSADAQQTWAGLGARTRDETGTITCLALSWNGDADLKTARAAVKAITAAVESTLRADPTLGGAIDGLLWTGYGERTQLIQLQAEDGASVICVFDIAFRARLRST